MNKWKLLGLIIVFGFGPTAFAKSVTPAKVNKARTTTPVAATTAAQPNGALLNQLNHALQLVQAGQYQQAVPQLYTLSRNPGLVPQRMQITYILGVSLMNLGLNQIAAFKFVEVIRNGNNHYVKQAIERLSLAADALGDDTLLNYAVSRISLDDIPENGKDLIYYRLGEIKQRNGQFAAAEESYNHVPNTSRYAFLAKYAKGLALLQQNRPKDAIPIFKDLVNSRTNANVTDTNKVVAKISLARAYYQATDWENAVIAYREIPRDHPLWHDALFESSWALFRSARFRSVLSNFQSLHSSYYDDFYIPESLVLRSIVYLYICKYDEMEKVLGLFDKTYGPLKGQIELFMQNNSDPLANFAEIDAAHEKRAGRNAPVLHLPAMVDFHILREGDVKRAFGYLRALNDEKLKLDALPLINKTAMGSVGRKILGNRYKNAKVYIGELVKNHLNEVRADLKDLYEQAEFVRYEMINGEKEQLRKKMAGKEIPNAMVNDDVDRNMYVQNGYEYWPFDGEFWLDEIGNYHYLGKQSCE